MAMMGRLGLHRMKRHVTLFVSFSFDHHRMPLIFLGLDDFQLICFTLLE